MESLQTYFPIEEECEKKCDRCGSLYKLYKTPKGISGACKVCVDQQLKQELNLPTIEEVRKNREEQFIQSFEHVTGDILNVTVNEYNPRNDSQHKAKQISADFIENFNSESSLIFSGTSGLGKSHLSYGITKALRSRGYKVLFLKVTELLDYIKDTYKDESMVTEVQIFNMLASLDLLALDDLGSEYVKTNNSGYESWSTDVLFKVFDQRLDKSIICTTNYSERELKTKYGNNGERIVDRMTDKAHGIRLFGESYRGKDRF